MTQTVPLPLIWEKAIPDAHGYDADGNKVFGSTVFNTVYRKDPRFPKPVRGGTQGSKTYYNREEVAAYFERCAREGFPTLEEIKELTSSKEDAAA